MDQRIERLNRLVRAAIAGTKRGELVWTAFDDETFHTTFGPGSLRITRAKFQAEDENGQIVPTFSYPFWVLDAEGHIAEELDYSEGTPARELYTVARSSAFGTDQLIDNMLTVLEARK